uniref:Calcineurin-like phosphoesterase domain-containing protein n=1 Tax=Romanomermis culicivorax TaxID=13658 RepID=A0A915JE04_ROMCU
MHCGFQMARWAKQKFFDLCPPLKYRFRFNGSLAYSFDIENVTFIQLHNYPTYERTFEAHLKRDRLICPAYAKGRYVIESSLDFLEEKLIEACSQKKPIIVCFHDPSEHFKSNQRFINMIEKYNVAGVFVGHFHHMYGRYFQQRNGYGHVPLFGSGSAIYGDYLLVRFFTKRVVNVMKVLIYNAANGSAWRKPIWREDRIVYLLPNMLTYLLLLFTCASAILLRQGPTDSNHSPWPYDIGLQNKGHKPIVGNKPFHQPIIRLGGGLSHARLPPQDHWDKELIAKLLPIMTEKPEPYLAYLDFWRLKKGRKSNNYEEEKNRFMNFVETVNRNLEHGMKAALEKKPEEAASSSSFNNPYGMPELAGITRNGMEQLTNS